MPVNDPVADMLTRIRNALQARHESLILPSSKLKVAIAQILKENGYIRDYDTPRGRPYPALRLHMAYRENRVPAISGLKRVSRPGLRTYVGKGEIPRVYGGLGISVLSTSRGVMTGRRAWQLGVGGELLCYVW
jgi:small subunit ribosomal protein S8